MNVPGTVVVVGTGQGGIQLAASLRDEGYGGDVILLGDDPSLPYHRPPLSKGYLTGKVEADSLALRGDGFYADHHVALRLGERVATVDRAQRRVQLETGTTLGYDHLVLATGGRNRPLPVPGAELDGVVQLRTLAEAGTIRQRLPEVRRAVVVGAGFIGLEFAAAAASTGIATTVIEATSRPMARALSLPMSEHFRMTHESAGVRLVFGAVVTRILGADGRAEGVETADGRVFPADMILVAIGIVPNVELGAEAGLAVANGIVVDAHLQSDDPDISAIGDCALFPSPFASGAPTRLESVQNAADQARCVAARLAGRPAPYRAVPWFWSDQGANKLQIAGIPVPHHATILRGAPASGAFSVFCFEADRLVAVESVNRPADHMAARRLLANRIAITPEDAADPAFDLKARAMAGPGRL